MSQGDEPSNPPPVEATESQPHSPNPRISCARRHAGGSVSRDRDIGFAEAVVERLAERDVVVWGGDDDENKSVAKEIERQAGGGSEPLPHKPHDRPGQRGKAMHHYHTASGSPDGHTFYEYLGRRAVRGRP